MENQIQLVQKPVIQHSLIEVGKSVTARIQELNLENLVATDDTIKSLKELRAELNKEFTEFESQRKALKNAVSAPYQEFEAVYVAEISEKYKQAGELLKDKIGAFEANVKAEKETVIKEYFDELTASANIDFLTFKHTGIKIDLSTSEKKYKEECQAFVSRVQDDIILINAVDYPAETMAEYKSNGLNASKAITTVRDRKEAERLEEERVKQNIVNKRTALLRSLAMIYNSITRSYCWVNDENIYIDLKDVENLPDAEFTKKYAEIESAIKSKQPAPVHTEIPKKQVQEVLKAPVEVQPEVKEKLLKASFECTGTRSQLIALGQYMKENSITYKNI